MGSIRARSETGLLFFDFRYRGQRCREQTLLADTPTNRKRLEKALAKIEADIAAGTFDYAATFPGSKAVPAAPVVLAQASAVTPTQAAPSPLFRDFLATWLSEHQVEWRRSHIKVLRSTLDQHLLPRFGDKPVASITKADILAFRAKLAELPGRTGERLSNKRINGILAPLRQIHEQNPRLGGIL